MSEVTMLEQVRDEAVDNLITKGWTQDRWVGDGGSVCLHQAVRLCSPQTGDGYVLSAALSALGYSTRWNDSPNRIADDVLAVLKGLDPTDEWLEETFGSSWRRVVAVIRQAASLTLEQSKTVAQSRGAVATAARDAAFWAARGAADAAGDAAAADATWAAAREAAWDAARNAVAAARDAAREAMDAALTHHLIGTHGYYTQEHYDTLMAPWLVAFPEVPEYE